MSGDAQSTIAMLQSSSLTSVVQQEIERRILGGELAPGDKLIEAALAQALGVSRGPVREAFRMLEQAGLLRQEKNRGVFVRQLNIDEAMEIYELRAMMDEAVARQLALAISAEQLQQLRRLVEAMTEAAGSADADRYHRLNLQFHDALIGFGGNRKLSLVYRRLINELSLFRRMNLDDAGQLPVSAAEHRAIVEAIARGDAEAAGRAMRAHVTDSRSRTLRHHRAASAAPAMASVAAPNPAREPPSPGPSGPLPQTQPQPRRPPARPVRPSPPSATASRSERR